MPCGRRDERRLLDLPQAVPLQAGVSFPEGLLLDQYH